MRRRNGGGDGETGGGLARGGFRGLYGSCGLGGYVAHRWTLGAYHPFEPLLEEGDIEVDQQSDGTAGQLQIGEQLRGVYRQKRSDALDLDDHLAADPQIEEVDCSTGGPCRSMARSG